MQGRHRHVDAWHLHGAGRIAPGALGMGVLQPSVHDVAPIEVGWRDSEWAGQLPTVALQEKVSAALEALPRGREPSPPGDRFRRTVLAAMPDIEAMELVDRFFELGAEVVGTPHPIGIFLAGCRECLGEWELQASRWSHPSSRRAGEPIALDQTVCPRGQTTEPTGDAQP